MKQLISENGWLIVQFLAFPAGILCGYLMVRFRQRVTERRGAFDRFVAGEMAIAYWQPKGRPVVTGVIHGTLSGANTLCGLRAFTQHRLPHTVWDPDTGQAFDAGRPDVTRTPALITCRECQAAPTFHQLVTAYENLTPFGKAGIEQ